MKTIQIKKRSIFLLEAFTAKDLLKYRKIIKRTIKPIKLVYFFLILFSSFAQSQVLNDTILKKLDSVNFKYQRPTFNYFDWKSPNVTRIDSLKIFSLSPISRKVNRVDGFAFGFGHYENQRIKKQTINGLNLEVSPLAAAFLPFINIPIEGLFVGINDRVISNSAFFDDEYETYIVVNGLNISSGGFMGGAQMNGLNLSVVSAMNQMNGLSLNASILHTKSFNGLSISGIANISYVGNGIQIAISNVSRKHRGIQIGLFNYSKDLRGFQFGLWNTNGKRKLPFINWQFKP